jgi:nucleotide sugar dehydrogenase
MPHYPSIGVGGHCIPVDPYYLIEYARNSGFDHEFLSLARNINNFMPTFTVDELTNALSTVGIDIKDAQITLLGLSYKPNVADDRESPSYRIRDILIERGANVVTFDPYMESKSDVDSIEKACKNTDAIIVAVNHADFLTYDFASTSAKVFLDGKNAFDPEKFPTSLIYKGIGV